jgi:hypothetical protein
MSTAGRLPATTDHFFGTVALALKEDAVYALVLIFSVHVTGSIRGGGGGSVTRLDRLV